MNFFYMVILIIIGVFSIVGSLYKFFKWLNDRRGKKVSRPNAKTALTYIEAQNQILRTWRLFSFHRDITIEDIYVQEILRSSSEPSPLRFIPTKSHPIEEKQIFKWVRGRVEENEQIYLIVGQAGSGKSTMLRNWTLSLLSEHQKPHSEQFLPLPVYISLRNFHTVEKNPNLEITRKGLATSFARTIPLIEERDVQFPFLRVQQLRSEESKAKFKSLLHKSKKRKMPLLPEWIFFCDGLDEMSSEYRPAFFNWVKSLSQQVRVVIATRPGILEESGRPSRSKEYEICDFNRGQIHRFISQWFHDNIPLGEALLKQLESNQDLYRLAAIPLLLTCLCMDVEVRQNSNFPQRLIESDLLRRAVEILLDHWDAIKEGRSVDRNRIKVGMRVLTELATSHPFGTNFTFEELMIVVDRCARELGINQKEAEIFLRQIITSGRMLMGDRNYGYSFSHSIFFDFFFAEGVRTIIRRTENLEGGQ